MQRIDVLKKLLYINIFIFLCYSMCSCGPKYYFEYEGVWCSDEPFIEFDGVSGEGIIIINEKEYEVSLGFANNGTYIDLDDKKQVDEIYIDENGNYSSGITEDMLIWRADTEVKDGKLYMTVTKDNVADYEGETIVLELREE